MVHMFRSRGFEIKSLDFTTYYVELELEVAENEFALGLVVDRSSE